MYEGIVAKVIEAKGFGFIAVVNSPDVFFHANDLIELEFGEQLQGQRVKFTITTSPKGPRAAGITAAD